MLAGLRVKCSKQKACVSEDPATFPTQVARFGYKFANGFVFGSLLLNHKPFDNPYFMASRILPVDDTPKSFDFADVYSEDVDELRDLQSRLQPFGCRYVPTILNSTVYQRSASRYL